ncbi:MAG: TlpA disulfide reductase family protein, partial [Bacteroidota bacterium]
MRNTRWMFVVLVAVAGTACNPSTLNWQDLNVRTLQHQPIALGEYQGEKILLNFWATWCGPCVAELPSMIEAHEQLGDQVRFVLVSDEDPTVIERFAQQKNLPFDMLHLEASFQVAGIVSIPQTYLIDSHGK